MILFDSCSDKKNTIPYFAGRHRAIEMRDSIVAATWRFHARRVGSSKITIT